MAGLFGFDPTPHFSLTNAAKNVLGSIGNAVLGSPSVSSGYGNTGSHMTRTPASAPVANTGQGGSASDPYAAQAAQQASDRNNLLASLAAQQNQINAQMGRLDPTLAVGVANINNAYQNTANRLGQQLGVAERDYNTGVQDTTSQYQSARNQVAGQVRSRLNALQQLLGQAGAGNSSASGVAAPYAATREGTQQLAPVQSTYATNRRNLDTNWQDTQRNYQNEVADAWQQRYAQEQALRQSIEQNRADLLQKLMDIGVQRGAASGQNVGSILSSQAGQQAALNNILNSIVNLGSQYANPVIAAQDIKYAAPDLGKYAIGPQGEITTDIPGASDVSPILQPILSGKKEDQNNNLSTALAPA